VTNIATKAFISLPAGRFITGTARIPVQFHLGHDFIAGFEDAPHCVNLRLKNFVALLIGGAEIGGAADASLRHNAVWELLNHDIGRAEISYFFEWTHRSDCLKILLGASDVG